jgi:hypothetical protein
MYVTCNYNYMLDFNETTLKPKKSQMHGMDIWGRCHTKCALCGISHNALRPWVIYLQMYLYHEDSSGAFENIDLIMRNLTCICGLKHHKMIETTIKTIILMKLYMYIIVIWDGHITLGLPHHWSGHWIHHYSTTGRNDNVFWTTITKLCLEKALLYFMNKTPTN